MTIQQQFMECKRSYKDFLVAGKAYPVRIIDNTDCMVMTSLGFPIKVAREYFMEKEIEEEIEQHILSPLEEVKVLNTLYDLITTSDSVSKYTPISEKRKIVLDYIQEESKENKDKEGKQESLTAPINEVKAISIVEAKEKVDSNVERVSQKRNKESAGKAVTYPTIDEKEVTV